MKSLSVTWTSQVDLLEVRFALSAIQEIIGGLQELAFYRGWFDAAPSVNVFGDWYIPDLPEDADYRSLQWYVETAYDPVNDGVIGGKFLELVIDEPWQKVNPHLDLCLLGERFVQTPIQPEGADALAMLAPGRATAISMAPLQRIKEEQMRLFTVRRVVAHQLGHLLGLPSSGRRQSATTDGQERHCLNTCAMSQATDLDALVERSFVELDDEVLLCDDCWDDLVRSMMDDYFGPN